MCNSFFLCLLISLIYVFPCDIKMYKIGSANLHSVQHVTIYATCHICISLAGVIAINLFVVLSYNLVFYVQHLYVTDVYYMNI